MARQLGNNGPYHPVRSYSIHIARTMEKSAICRQRPKVCEQLKQSTNEFVEFPLLLTLYQHKFTAIRGWIFSWYNITIVHISTRFS